jgi:C-terminal processing protease CtpA/Prc
VDWARVELEIGERLKVISIDQGSLVSQAGLMQGDVIVSINDLHIRRGHEGVDTLTNKITPEIDWPQPVRILVIRDGGAIELEFPASDVANTLAMNLS